MLSLTVNLAWGWVVLVVGSMCRIAALLFFARLTGRRYFEQAPKIFAMVSVGDRV